MKRFHSWHFSLFPLHSTPLSLWRGVGGEAFSLFTFHSSFSSPRGGREGAFRYSFIGSQIRLLESTPVEDDALNHLSCVDACELESVLFEGFVDRYTQCEFLAVLQHLLFPWKRPFGELVFQNDWGLSIHADAEAIALSFVDGEEWQAIYVEREHIGRDGSRGVVSRGGSGSDGITQLQGIPVVTDAMNHSGIREVGWVGKVDDAASFRFLFGG